MVDHRPESLDDDLPHHDDHDEDDDDDVSCSAAGPVITVAVEPMFGLVSAPPSPQPPPLSGTFLQNTQQLGPPTLG